jgi:hypothetical protein
LLAGEESQRTQEQYLNNRCDPEQNCVSNGGYGVYSGFLNDHAQYRPA